MLSSSFKKPTICKTKHAHDSYWYCLASMTSYCHHKFYFGEHHYCLHDDKIAFRDRESEYFIKVGQI
jgi:hypothetical protein